MHYDLQQSEMVVIPWKIHGNGDRCCEHTMGMQSLQARTPRGWFEHLANDKIWVPGTVKPLYVDNA